MGKAGKESEVEEKRRFYSVIAIGGQITVMLVRPVVVFLFLGLWLDGYFQVSPLFLVVGVIVGFVGSIMNVFKVMEMMEKL